MPQKTATSTPRYCLHKATDQGYVKLNGKPVYLGKYDLPETRQKYHRILSEWEHNGRVPLVPVEDARILDLIDRYYHWAKTYYRNQTVLTPHG